jgi:hypothetical protein
LNARVPARLPPPSCLARKIGVSGRLISTSTV